MSDNKEQLYRFINACLAHGFDPVDYMLDGKGLPMQMVEEALNDAFDSTSMVDWHEESEIAKISGDLMKEIENLYKRGIYHPEDRDKINVELSLRNGFVGVSVVQLAIALKHMLLPVLLQYSLRNASEFDDIQKICDTICELMDYVIDTLRNCVEEDGAVQQKTPEEVKRILEGLTEKDNTDSDGWEYRIQ